MSPPGWVATLDDYWQWAEAALQGAGANLPPTGLNVERVVGGTQEVAIFEEDVISFHDDTFLRLSMVVSEDLQLHEYCFHFAHLTGGIIWRKDRHEGHEREVGGREHVHLPYRRDREHVFGYREVALADVLQEVDDYRDGSPLTAKHIPRHWFPGAWRRTK